MTAPTPHQRLTRAGLSPAFAEIDAGPLPNKQIKDRRGQTFGRLTVVAHAGSGAQGKTEWWCVCSGPDCNRRQVKVLGTNLASGNTTSCGCVQGEARAATGRGKATHGLTGHPLLSVWSNMVARCHNPARSSYARYGARGIRVHPEWRNTPAVFAAYVEKLPGYGEPGMQLDRIDNNGNYEPGNVRWVTSSQNNRNKRTNRLIEFRGQTRCLTEWAEALGLHYYTVHNRLGRLSWPVERALTEGVKPEVLARLFGPYEAADLIDPEAQR